MKSKLAIEVHSFGRSRRSMTMLSVCGLLGGAIVAGVLYQHDAPRRDALAVVGKLEEALTQSDLRRALPLIELPPAAAMKSANEQELWLADVLRDELSKPGLDEVRRHAQFGALDAIFPGEANRWAESAHVVVQDCVAFRMERNGVRAELVLHRSSSGVRILRSNNIKQMAMATTARL